MSCSKEASEIHFSFTKKQAEGLTHELIEWENNFGIQHITVICKRNCIEIKSSEGTRIVFKRFELSLYLL